MRFEVGDGVRVEFTKWGGATHWGFDGIFLGEDEHGEWLGHPAGTRLERPERKLTAEAPWVTLVPRTDAAHLVTVNAPPHRIEIYVDITTPPQWDAAVLRAVDLDLDVIRLRGVDEVYLDDEDEFEAHQLAYGYPPEIISMAEESAERVLAAVRARRAPYDATAQRWLDVLTDLGR